MDTSLLSRALRRKVPGPDAYEINAARTEQSAGVLQVGEAVSQLDRVTQQNAALVEESAAAAENSRVQAQQLVQAVAVFKLAYDREGHAAPAVPSPAPVHAALPFERRGTNRAKNLARPAFGSKSANPSASTPAVADASAKADTEDGWAKF